MTDAALSKSTLLTSLAIHAAVLGLFALLMLLFPTVEPEPKPIEVVFYKPAERIPTPPPAAPVVPEPPAPEPQPQPEVRPQIAKADPPPKPEKLVPKPVEPVQVAKVEPRPEPVKRAPVVTKPALKPQPKPTRPAEPRRTVQTNLLNAAVTKPVTPLEQSTRKTTTGAFGAAEKADVPTPSRKSLRGGTQVGSFAVTQESSPAGKPADRAVVATGAFGSAESDGTGRGSAAPAGAVSTGGFGSTATAKRPQGGREVKSEAPDTPVEVLSKVSPVYTSQARELRIEGEVTLRVTFTAAGEIVILGVVDTLGHGLDESAVDAAKRIRFKPARRDGRPVDHTTVLRIVFQLV